MSTQLGARCETTFKTILDLECDSEKECDAVTLFRSILLKHEKEVQDEGSPQRLEHLGASFEEACGESFKARFKGSSLKRFLQKFPAVFLLSSDKDTVALSSPNIEDRIKRKACDSEGTKSCIIISLTYDQS